MKADKLDVVITELKSVLFDKYTELLKEVDDQKDLLKLSNLMIDGGNMLHSITGIVAEMELIKNGREKNVFQKDCE